MNKSVLLTLLSVLIMSYQLAAQHPDRQNDKQSAKSSGDTKQRKSNSAAPKNETKYADKSQRTRKASKEAGESVGDVKVKGEKRQDLSDTKQQVRVDNSGKNKNNKAMAESSGDILVNYKSKRQNDKAMAQSTGDIRVDYSDQRKNSKSIANYRGEDYSIYESRAEGPRNSGAMVVARELDRKKMKEMANSEGDIGGNYLAKRTAMRHKKGKEIANSSGDILVRTLNQRAKKIRKKNKEMANYKGDIIVTKRKKGMHPSAVYRGGKVKNSYTAKERYRKRMMKKLNRQKGAEDPNYMKQKGGRPKHDKREAEIWY